MQDPGDVGALIAKETRRVQQELVAGRYEQALARAQDLERSLDNRRKTPAAVQQLVDVLASLVYLRTGSTQGYPGAVLKVRPPAQGSEWLCRPAEPDPALDDPLFYGTSDSRASLGAVPRLPTASAPLLLTHSEQPPAKDQAPDVTSPSSLQQRTALMLSRHRPRGYRCLTDAVKAASDGDVIEMLPGTHPSGSDSLDGGVVIDKRLLIRGAPDKTVCLDHRANHPVLRLQRGALITGLSIEMSGFREAVRCEGACSYPTVDHCSISCSGSDAVHVTGRCCPLLANCQLQGKKCGLRVWSDKSDYDSIAGSSGGQAPPHTQPRLLLLRVPAQLQPCLPSTPSSPAPTHSTATAASQQKARGNSQPTLTLPEAAAKNSVLARLLIQQPSSASCCPAAQSPSPPPCATLADSSGVCTPLPPHTSPAPALSPSPPPARAVTAACLPGPHAQLLGCSMAGCGVSGVAAAGSAFVEMVGGCVVEGCSQEGVALSGVAVAMLRGVEVRACGGPALDLAGDSKAVLQGCLLEGCGGGVWVWDSSTAWVLGPGTTVHVLPNCPALLASGGRATPKPKPLRLDGGCLGSLPLAIEDAGGKGDSSSQFAMEGGAGEGCLVDGVGQGRAIRAADVMGSTAGGAAHVWAARSVCARGLVLGTVACV